MKRIVASFFLAFFACWLFAADARPASQSYREYAAIFHQNPVQLAQLAGGMMFPGPGTPAASGWTPATLGANLVGWYEANIGVFKDAGVTPAGNGDTVQQWNDQSGGGNNLSQATPASRPALNTTGLNGHPTLGFVAANTQTLATASFPLGTGTVTSACMVGTITASSPAFSRIVSYSPDRDWFLVSGSTTSIRGFDGSSQLSGATIVNGTNYSFCGVWDGVNFTLYLNNVAGSSDPSTFSLTNNQAFSIGTEANGAAPFDGNISEVIVTKSAMSSTDRNNWWAYVQAKWTLP